MGTLSGKDGETAPEETWAHLGIQSVAQMWKESDSLMEDLQTGEVLRGRDNTRNLLVQRHRRYITSEKADSRGIILRQTKKQI